MTHKKRTHCLSSGLVRAAADKKNEATRPQPDRPFVQHLVKFILDRLSGPMCIDVRQRLAPNASYLERVKKQGNCFSSEGY